MLLTIEQRTAEAQLLAFTGSGGNRPADKQKALFYRGLVRFPQVVQKGRVNQKHRWTGQVFAEHNSDVDIVVVFTQAMASSQATSIA